VWAGSLRALPRVFAAGAALAFLFSAAAGRGEGAFDDPTLPRRVQVGPPSGLWPMYRADGARTGRVRILIPTTPVVTRKIPLFADLATAPVVDARGRLAIATRDGKLVEVGTAGQVFYSLTLDAPAVLGPVITSDGTRVVVTRDGVATGVSKAGDVVFSTPLAPTKGPLRAEPLATRDGAAVVAIGTRAIKVGAGGAVEATTDLDEVVTALTELGRTLFLSTETGQVFEWRPPNAPRSIGSFGGRPTSEVVAEDPSRLLAVVRNASLVELGVRDGGRVLIADLAPDAIADGPALTPTGEARVATRSGLVLGYRDARETFRHSVAPPSPMTTFGFVDAGLPPVTDRTGATASVTPTGSLAIVLPTGEVRTAMISECGLPAALVPSGERQLAVFCRSGFIAIIGEPTGVPAELRPPPAPSSR
jgi:hypothetical protein